jgi:hypothetical protein
MIRLRTLTLLLTFAKEAACSAFASVADEYNLGALISPDFNADDFERVAKSEAAKSIEDVQKATNEKARQEAFNKLVNRITTLQMIRHDKRPADRLDTVKKALAILEDARLQAAASFGGQLAQNSTRDEIARAVAFASGREYLKPDYIPAIKERIKNILELSKASSSDPKSELRLMQREYFDLLNALKLASRMTDEDDMNLDWELAIESVLGVINMLNTEFDKALPERATTRVQTRDKGDPRHRKEIFTIPNLLDDLVSHREQELLGWLESGTAKCRKKPEEAACIRALMLELITFLESGDLSAEISWAPGGQEAEEGAGDREPELLLHDWIHCQC